MELTAVPHCAFLTIANLDGWFVDDELVHPSLKRRGWQVSDVAWDADVDWNQFDIVVIRSTWDYQQTPGRFFSVLEQIEASSARLYNPLHLVKWNLDKRYLLELESKNIRIVPTRVVESLTRDCIRKTFPEFAADQIVVKPTIGANSDDTFRIQPGAPDSELQKICDVFASKPCLLQPFMEHITREGEYSVIFFEGRCSHAVVKSVRSGDFRVQEEHGGSVRSVPDIEPKLEAAARAVMHTLAEPPLYARVDLVRMKQQDFALMELELVEPSLYFKYSDDAADAFAKSIDDRLLRCSGNRE